MKIQVVKVGRPVAKEYEKLVATFQSRLQPFAKVESIEVKASGGIEKSEKALLSAIGMEGDMVLKPHQYLVALDERGKNLSSPELAGYIQTWSDDPQVKLVTFLIGGPYGLSDNVKNAATMLWSLSRAVFPSDLAWVLVWEQLFRASAIIRKTGYHHE